MNLTSVASADVGELHQWGMRNLVPVKARLVRCSMFAIGQSASEPEPHRVRSKSLAIVRTILMHGVAPQCAVKEARPSLGGEAGVAPPASSGHLRFRPAGRFSAATWPN